MKSSIINLQTISEGVYQHKGGIFLFDDSIRNFLIRMAQKSRKKRSRICLHESTQSNTQNMIICLLENQKFTKHKHPLHKSESYSVISGELHLDIYKNNETLSHKLILNSLNTPYMHPGGVIHQPYTKENMVIYHEIYHGNFDRDIDVEEFF